MKETKDARVVRYDLYRRPTTPRLPPIFIESYDAHDTSELFTVGAKALYFDKTSMLSFFNTHSFKQSGIVSKKGGLIVKVFANCSPADRIKAEKMRIDGIYDKEITEERKVYRDNCQKLLNEMLDVMRPRNIELESMLSTSA